MSFLKKMNIKLTLIISIFMLIILISNISILNNNFKKSIQFTCEAQYDEIIANLDETVKILEVITKKIATNEKIIEILDNNKSFTDLGLEDTDLMTNQINIFEEILGSLTFVKTINITSIPGKYLFSNGLIYNNFDVESRPWFTDELLNNNGDTIISDIHTDYNSGEATMSIVSLIHSNKDDSILGAVVLDIFVDDLIKDIDSKFYLGDLETYIGLEDGRYYSGNESIEHYESFSSQFYMKKGENVIKDGISLIFKFDKKSIIYNKSFRAYNKFQISSYLIFGIILTIVLIRILKYTFMPITNCIRKFKYLLKTSKCEEVDFENEDELEQLEFISNALSKSFDDKIKQLIYYDELTKLPNRKMLLKRVDELIDNEKEFALIFIDLNRFKKVNDLFGHLVGDEILKCFSNRINTVMKAGDMLARYSGDEFIILYTDYKGENDLIDFYENNVLEVFKNTTSINNNNILIEFSAGVSVYPRDGEHLDELINKSDFMMYENKNNSAVDKDKLLFFNDEIYKKIIKVETIKSELSASVEKNEFTLYYQPIVDKNMIVKKVEVLIRWKNEKLGFVAPMDFISYAEETRDIISIGYWIIEDVCRNYNELTYGYKDKLQVSINVSPVQLMEIDFIEKIESIINKYNIEYKCICFEITESVVLDSNSVVLSNIEGLYKLGIKIALDDFGTGYASFSYLKKFKLDILKIDKIFIDNANEMDYKIVNNIKSIAHNLRMDTVIEGVETLEQFNMLKGIECDFFQGYYFSKPITLNEMKKFLMVNRERE